MYKILQPFAPMIYHGQCSEEFLKFLQDSLDPTWEEGENMSHVLAGNMEKQFKMVSDPATFVEYIYPHVLNYVRACHERYNEYVLEPDQYDVSKSEGVTAVKFDFPAAPWINFQHKHEFNPIHMHGGALSAVIMIDIPIEIEESFRESKVKLTCQQQDCWSLFMVLVDGYILDHIRLYLRLVTSLYSLLT